MKETKSAFREHQRMLLIPVGIALVFSLLSVFTFWKPVEYALYDLFLKIKPPVAEASNILLIDVDDNSIIKKGDWPWPRGNMAKILEVLTVVDASCLVFDIEYLENSPMSVNRQYLSNGLPLDFSIAFADIGGNIEDSFSAVKARQTTIDEILPMLIDSVVDIKNSLLRNTQKVAIENDVYLGQAIRLFGRASVTLNLQEKALAGGMQTEGLKAYAAEHFSYPLISGKFAWPVENVDFLVPIKEISSMAMSAGFTNVPIDPDGVRRRIRLIDKVGDKNYTQLAFTPLLIMLGKPELELQSNALIIKKATINGKQETIRIPVDSHGNMLIHWPKKKYMNSFSHISAIEILDITDKEEALAAILQSIRTSKLWAYGGAGYQPIEEALVAYNGMIEAKDQALASGSEEDKAAWLSSRSTALETIQAFIDGGFDKDISASIGRLKADKATLDSLKTDEANLKKLFEELAATFKLYLSNLETVRKKVSGKFCITGWTAAATTDIGVNPFEEKYVNVGTHAAVVNTILQRDFLREAPIWVSIPACLILSFLIVLLVRRFDQQSPLRIISGILFILVSFVAAYLIFHFSGLFVPFVAPGISVILSYLTFTLVTVIFSEREKSFIRKAFSTYLSRDIIKELIDDPAMLKLGGQKKYITAFFTDVKGFSTISEQRDPEQLVKLLNIYLSKMSDIILENAGTIDKYEGDAIIAFFGAPVWNELHARNACISAIRMKKAEEELNTQVLAEDLSPSPLLTRIGINTGDMVVGNMGTQQKMNYTIMGNAVNLAARLEGVNKQYGSWILTTKETLDKAGEGFVTRAFDRVRVVGIHTPVQLYELVDLADEMSSEDKDFIRRFNEAHDLFENKAYQDSLEAFKALIAEKDDAPTKTYISRCENFIKNKPRADWDGVFNLTEK